MAERLAVLLSGQVVGHLDRRTSGDDPTFSYTTEYVRAGEVAERAVPALKAHARHILDRLGGPTEA
ncbi:hypothetical protein [Actinorugispora endophytica]|uniref:Uncharacterized protein n=1 Tax=Actinorugispora endophytica TaxID=1605990 RepID=A0A4R6UXN2_9ACTN|nr:hypothetical protein [Actinorugispora endophytica]TDQ52227.1 hypothetical protein EV190_10759 [Actinorugispora endophytica]